MVITCSVLNNSAFIFRNFIKKINFFLVPFLLFQFLFKLYQLLLGLLGHRYHLYQQIHYTLFCEDLYLQNEQFCLVKLLHIYFIRMSVILLLNRLIGLMHDKLAWLNHSLNYEILTYLGCSSNPC